MAAYARLGNRLNGNRENLGSYLNAEFMKAMRKGLASQLKI